MSSESLKISNVTGILQLVVLIIGVGGIFFTFGTREEVLNSLESDVSELRAISSDLVKAQVLSQAKDGEHDRMLQDILVRLARLEQ